MDVAELRAFLDENPKMREILRLAIEAEETSPDQKGQYGWEWHDVRAHPSSLMKLVVAGIVKVNYKSNRSTMYLLIDRPTAKKALSPARRLLVIPDRSKLQAALDRLLKDGIDARPANWSPEVVTSPPARAGVTVPESQTISAQKSLDAAAITWLDLGPATPTS